MKTPALVVLVGGGASEGGDVAEVRGTVGAGDATEILNGTPSLVVPEGGEGGSDEASPVGRDVAVVGAQADGVGPARAGGGGAAQEEAGEGEGTTTVGNVGVGSSTIEEEAAQGFQRGANGRPLCPLITGALDLTNSSRRRLAITHSSSGKKIWLNPDRRRAPEGSGRGNK